MKLGYNWCGTNIHKQKALYNIARCVAQNIKSETGLKEERARSYLGDTDVIFLNASRHITERILDHITNCVGSTIAIHIKYVELRLEFLLFDDYRNIETNEKIQNCVCAHEQEIGSFACTFGKICFLILWHNVCRSWDIQVQY